MTSYEKLKNIQNKNMTALFVMAMAYIIDTGFATVIELTDDDIKKMHCSAKSLMTSKVAQQIATLAREMCQACESDGVELIQFCMAEGVFETRWYANKLSIDALTEMLTDLIVFLHNDKQMSFDDICDWMNVDVEDLIDVGIIKMDD